MPHYKAIQFEVTDRGDSPTGESKIVGAGKYQDVLVKLCEEIEGPAYIRHSYVYPGEEVPLGDYRGKYWGVLQDPVNMDVENRIASEPEPPEPIRLTDRQVTGSHAYHHRKPNFYGSCDVGRSYIRVDDKNNDDFWLAVEITREMKLMILQDFITNNPDVNLQVEATEEMKLKVLLEMASQYREETGRTTVTSGLLKWQMERVKSEKVGKLDANATTL